MKIINTILKFKTKKHIDFIDLTDDVVKFTKKTNIKNGFICIYSKHTTLALRINEKEKGIFTDFKGLVNKITPKNIYYHHNDLNIRTENLVCDPGASDCLNGHSHCLHLLMGTSEMIPIINGHLVLGIFQRVFAIELDTGRPRQVVLQIIGN